ncbi:hypothetical protein SDC9_122266 [bioreactor metagenome]|uniref:Lipoprotein n=1 Tax=bioreactor metagenome TaxID=1076179 RepID=A0A645CEC4_9ZZZZ|nr:hypothetical protein [Paludibacter sp.]
MKSIQAFSFILICTILFCSCESLIEKLFGKNEELTFTRTDYNGNQLRTDGYYYFKNESNDSTYNYRIYFFYKNGVVLDCGNPSDDELNTREEEFKNGQFNKYVKKNVSSWGLFKIDSTMIQFEMLHGGPFRAYIDFGKIINDTTFVLTKRKSSYGTDEIKLQGTFRLKPFSPKPDSTNVFIK